MRFKEMIGAIHAQTPTIESSPDYPPPKPKMREATLGDYAQIQAIQTRNRLDSRSRENWLSFWHDNPVYRRREGNWPIGWVLETVDDQVVGWLGNLPSTYYFRGSELLGASASPWVVDKSYRAYSTLLLNQFTKQKGAHLLINTTAGPNADPVSRLFGLSKVPVGIWDRAGFWVTHYHGFVQAALNVRAIPLARWLSYPLATALFCHDHFKINQGRPLGSQIELWPTFNSRFDVFWEELEQQSSNILLAMRNRETLLWHFRDKLALGQVWIMTISRASKLVAYAILTQDENALGLKRVRLIDFQALYGFEDTICRFLTYASHKCRRQGIHMLEITGCWLERAGIPLIRAPHHRSLPSWILYYKATASDLAKALRDHRVWAPSSFDGDASI